MDLKKSTITVLSLVFFIMIGLCCSSVFSAEKVPLGSIVPDFKLKGPDSPQTKAYLGVNDEKLFSFSQIKTKLVLIECFDVF